ncbi:MAG TPA: hypothetical protein VEI57_10740, partial [Nitrospirota bacterium]|nr:hypothetical protein [Nitrospirota bacterium]
LERRRLERCVTRGAEPQTHSSFTSKSRSSRPPTGTIDIAPGMIPIVNLYQGLCESERACLGRTGGSTVRLPA